jgi:hypothetical protein
VFDRGSQLLVVLELFAYEILHVHVQVQALSFLDAQAMAGFRYWSFCLFAVAEVLLVDGSPVFLYDFIDVVFLELQVSFLASEPFFTYAYFCGELSSHLA